MTDTLEQKIFFYITCAIPPLLFFLVTRNEKAKSEKSSPTWLLILICFLEVLVPLAHDDRGNLLDRSVLCILVTIITSSMIFYIRDRNKSPEGKVIPPFYEFLSRWNEVKPNANHKKTDDEKKEVNKEKPTLSAARRDALKILLKGIFYIIISLPAFSLMDGFIRVCKVPPNIHTSVTYWSFLSTGYVPPKMLYYYMFFGIDLTMHIAIVPLLQLLIQAVQLNVISRVSWVQEETILKLHEHLTYFAAQPPLFNKPWLTRSVYDLWSYRWHQIFRPGFHQVAYQPVRRLFGENHETAGKLVGTIAVFLCSGLMHDYIVLGMLGYSNIKRPGILGYQTLFFLLQAIATLVSVHSPRLPTWVARVLTYVWVLYTAPFFGEPYIRLGLHVYNTLPGMPDSMDKYVAHICPYGSFI